MHYSLSSKSYNLGFKNIMARNWYLKIAPLAIAEESLGKRDGYLKPCYPERGWNNDTKKPKTWKTSRGCTKRGMILENVILSRKFSSLWWPRVHDLFPPYNCKWVNVPIFMYPKVLSQKCWWVSADQFTHTLWHSSACCMSKTTSWTTYTYVWTYIVMEKLHN